VVPSWPTVSCYQVYTIARLTINSNMGDGLIVVFKCSNSTFIMLYLYHEMDVDYLVADEIVNI
jgi:hypothetical protein